MPAIWGHGPTPPSLRSSALGPPRWESRRCKAGRAARLALTWALSGGPHLSGTQYRCHPCSDCGRWSPEKGGPNKSLCRSWRRGQRSLHSSMLSEARGRSAAGSLCWEIPCLPGERWGRCGAVPGPSSGCPSRLLLWPLPVAVVSSTDGSQASGTPLTGHPEARGSLLRPPPFRLAVDSMLLRTAPRTYPGRGGMPSSMTTSTSTSCPSPPTSGCLGQASKGQAVSGTRKKRRAAVKENRALGKSDVPGLTFLQSCSVKAGGKRGYQSIWKKFEVWATWAGHKLDVAASLDHAASEFLDVMNKDGEGLAMGQRLVASVQFHRASMCRSRAKSGGSLPACRQGLRGFKRTAPPKSRLPRPWEVAAIIAMQMLLKGRRRAALTLLAQFELYLRPDQAYRVRAIDLVKPVHEHESHRFYTVLSPMEFGQPTKTEEFDNVVPLDLPLHAELGSALGREVTMRLGAS